MPTIALTGATGFVGQNFLTHFLSPDRLEQGWQVKALTRRRPPIESAALDQTLSPSSAPDLQTQAIYPSGLIESQSTASNKQGLTWVYGDLDDKEALSELLEGCDYLVHVAGLTKALTRADYFHINADACALLADLARQKGVGSCIFISSLAARAPHLSAYGASKAAGEAVFLEGDWPFRSYILRPPALYGPGEKELYPMIKAASGFGLLRFIFPAMGGLKSRASFLHVDDLARAVLCLLGDAPGAAPPKTRASSELARLQNPPPIPIYEIDDGHAGGYSPMDMARAFSGRKKARPFLLPLFYPFLWPLGLASDFMAKIRQKPTMTSRDHLRYLTHPDWVSAPDKAFDLSDWAPQFNLFSGLAQTREWYRQNGLL